MDQFQEAEKFKRDFKQLDDSVLISPMQWGYLTGQTAQAVYLMRRRGALPCAAIDKNRFVRWTCGQFRAWVNGLTNDPPVPRRGRPRKSSEAGSK